LSRTTKIAFVITFILVFSAAILIYPNLNASQRFDEEYAALRSLQMFFEAEQVYFSKNKKYATLSELVNDGLIDKSFSNWNRFNYRFEIELREGGFEAFATPIWNLRTGLGGERRSSFYINNQHVFTRGDKQGRRADANDEGIVQ
jgi:hypothetical protein